MVITTKFDRNESVWVRVQICECGDEVVLAPAKIDYIMVNTAEDISISYSITVELDKKEKFEYDEDRIYKDIESCYKELDLYDKKVVFTKDAPDSLPRREIDQIYNIKVLDKKEITNMFEKLNDLGYIMKEPIAINYDQKFKYIEVDTLHSVFKIVPEQTQELVISYRMFATIQKIREY